MNEIVSIQTDDFEMIQPDVVIEDEAIQRSYADFEHTMTYQQYLRFHDDMI